MKALLGEIAGFLPPQEILPLTTLYPETTIIANAEVVDLSETDNPVEVLSVYRPNSIYELNLSLCDLTDDDLNTILRRQRRLEWLNVQNNRLVNPKLSHLRHLTYLNISKNKDFTGATLNRIKHVVDLNVDMTHLSQDGVHNLTELSELLTLKYYRVLREIPDLNQVKFPPGIQNLALPNGKFVPEFNFYRQFTSLRRLDLSDTNNDVDLTHLNDLQRLVMSYSPFSGSEFPPLLKLTHFQGFRSNLDPVYFGQWVNLRWLELHSEDLLDRYGSALSNLIHLRTLNLHGSYPGNVLTYLKHLRVRRLKLGGYMPLTPDRFRALSEIASLHTLDLAQTDYVPDALTWLRPPHLRYMGLGYVKDFVRVIRGLAGINLRKISLKNELTPEQVNSIVTNGIIRSPEDVLINHDFIPRFDLFEGL